MTKEGIIFFDSLGFGWVVEWDMIQQLYLDYWSNMTSAEHVLLSRYEDPLNFNPS